MYALCKFEICYNVTCPRQAYLGYKVIVLTLAMLNKLSCQAHFQFSANQIT